MIISCSNSLCTFRWLVGECGTEWSVVLLLPVSVLAGVIFSSNYLFTGERLV